tara:strand:+ start:2232 stop:2435 length:204 start_codon:yes stop_codon:yes gene_type:complete
MTQTVKTHMYLTPDLLDKIEAIAMHHDASRSQVVRALIQAGLDHKQCGPLGDDSNLRDIIVRGAVNA